MVVDWAAHLVASSVDSWVGSRAAMLADCLAAQLVASTVVPLADCWADALAEPMDYRLAP